MKKRVLVVAGAGASLMFGLPSVSDIDTLFATWANADYKLVTGPHDNLYTYVRDQTFFGCSRVEQIRHEFGIQYQVRVSLQSPEVQLPPDLLDPVYCYPKRLWLIEERFEIFKLLER